MVRKYQKIGQGPLGASVPQLLLRILLNYVWQFKWHNTSVQHAHSFFHLRVHVPPPPPFWGHRKNFEGTVVQSKISVRSTIILVHGTCAIASTISLFTYYCLIKHCVCLSGGNFTGTIKDCLFISDGHHLKIEKNFV